MTREVGWALHDTLIGHEVTVRTPGDTAAKGLLVAVGQDRLVIHTGGGPKSMVRLLTTRLEIVE